MRERAPLWIAPGEDFTTYYTIRITSASAISSRRDGVGMNVIIRIWAHTYAARRKVLKEQFVNILCGSFEVEKLRRRSIERRSARARARLES